VPTEIMSEAIIALKNRSGGSRGSSSSSTSNNNNNSSSSSNSKYSNNNNDSEMSLRKLHNKNLIICSRQKITLGSYNKKVWEECTFSTH
jgi:hypothetical protein